MVLQEQPQQLIARWIEPHPWKRSVADARLKDYKIAVWALIGGLRMRGGDIAQAAEDYRIPREAMEAALAYYQQHRAVIDDRLVANGG